MIDEGLPAFRLSVPKAPKTINLVELFPNNPKEVHLEVGFGAGEHLITKATQNPGVGFIGFDPFLNGVASLLDQLMHNNVKNVRIFDDDVRLIINCFPLECVNTLYILFSDPWPKARHHKRRVIQDDIIRIFANIMVDGGRVIFASDHMGFVQWTLKKFVNSPFFFWDAESKKDWSIQPTDWVSTRYEKKALFNRQEIAYLTFLRTSRT